MASPALPPWPATPPAAGGVLLRRWTEGRGFSFAVAETATGRAVGGLGVWLPELPQGRAEIGYAVAPAARGHGYAADALAAATTFAWTLPGLFRVQLHIEDVEHRLPAHRRAGRVPA